MIVNPGIRRFLGSAIQRLFNSASFYAPLTHTLALERGTGSPTFTRASTATVTNNDGYLVTALAGEARFVGARRVRNLLTYTEDFSNAAWSITGITRTATTITETATGTDHSIRYLVASGKNIWQIKVKPNGRTRCALASTGSTNKSAIFNLTTGAVEGALTDAFTTLGDNPTITLQSDGYYLITMGNLSGTSTLVDLYILDATSTVRAYAGDITKGLYVKQAQLEDITGRTDQTTPSEYVSVGVPSDWVGDELVTNGTFDTDTTWIKEAGWTIGGGVATHAAGVSATLYQGFNFVAGTTYVFSWDTVISAGAVSLRVGGGYLIPIDFKSASGTYTATYTAVTTATDLLGFVCDAPFAGTIDNFSVKPAIYHGSMVDGVKCFPTDLSGNPIPSTTMLGYSAEGAATNLCLQSQTFDNASWLLGAAGTTNPVVTANQIAAPDGTLTADKIEFPAVPSGVGNRSVVYQGIVQTAAAYCDSVWLKGAVGGEVVRIASSADGITWRTSSTLALTTSWVRYEITGTSTAATWYFHIGVDQRAGQALPTSAQTIYAWGAQVELGSFASSYIPTTTIAVARNADVLTYSSAGNIDGTKGWCYAEVTTKIVNASASVIVIAGNNGTDGYPMYISSSTGKLSLWDETAVRGFGTPTVPITTPNKFSTTWGGTTSAGAISGTVVSGAFDGDLGISSTFGVGATNNGLAQIEGTIRHLRLGQRQLSASEMQAITA